MTNEERQQAIEWLKHRPVMMAGAKRMYNLAVEALEQAHFVSGNTLVVTLPEEDLKATNRVLLDCKPWAKIFYADGGKDTNVPTKSALDHIHNVVRDGAYKRGYEQGKADAAPVVSVNGNTFMIDVSEEDFDKIKRVIVGCGPMCRVFYEEGGEAHWIKKYTPDDGEIYECDNCCVTWQFNDGGPEENEAFFCPKCGFKMVPKEGEVDGND